MLPIGMIFYGYSNFCVKSFFLEICALIVNMVNIISVYNLSDYIMVDRCLIIMKVNCASDLIVALTDLPIEMSGQTTKEYDLNEYECAYT